MKAVNRPFLTVIIPAYNEEERIEQTLKRVCEYLERQKYSWSIFVINDGSTDQTGVIVRRTAEKDNRIHLVEYHPNRGKGCAVRTGMLSANSDWLLFSDADLAAPIEEVEKLFQAQSPIAIGSRGMQESQLEIRQPRYREWAGRLFNKLVQLLGVPGIKDTQCGFKLFSHEAAKKVFSHCTIDGYGFDFEALMVARELGYSVVEVPIRWAHQEGSKVRLLQDGLRMIKDLVLLRLTLRRRLRDRDAKMLASP